MAIESFNFPTTGLSISDCPPPIIIYLYTDILYCIHRQEINKPYNITFTAEFWTDSLVLIE